MDVEEIISGLEDLDWAQLARVEAALSRRLQVLRADSPIGEADVGRPVSAVVEYRSHADGTLQKEVRRYYRKDGTPKEQGPYWYFRYHEGGKAPRRSLRGKASHGCSRERIAVEGAPVPVYAPLALPRTRRSYNEAVAVVVDRTVVALP